MLIFQTITHQKWSETAVLVADSDMISKLLFYTILKKWVPPQIIISCVIFHILV